jgi:hypothetical protein
VVKARTVSPLAARFARGACFINMFTTRVLDSNLISCIFLNNKLNNKRCHEGCRPQCCFELAMRIFRRFFGQPKIGDFLQNNEFILIIIFSCTNHRNPLDFTAIPSPLDLSDEHIPWRKVPMGDVLLVHQL